MEREYLLMKDARLVRGGGGAVEEVALGGEDSPPLVLLRHSEDCDWDSMKGKEDLVKLER